LFRRIIVAMTERASPDSPPARRRLGRPRRLSLEQVLDAALEAGLEGLTMTRVAERLGVSTAVLYGYVEGREQLVSIAAARAAQRHSFPSDTGQHWSEYARAHAWALFELLVGDAQLIVAFMGGGLGPAAEVDRAEAWMAALTRRGFAPQEALRLLRSVGLLAIGAAAAKVHARALGAAGETYAESARRAIAARPPNELPVLRRHIELFSREEMLTGWEAALLQLLRGVAAERGEILPGAASAPAPEPP